MEPAGAGAVEPAGAGAVGPAGAASVEPTGAPVEPIGAVEPVGAVLCGVIVPTPGVVEVTPGVVEVTPGGVVPAPAPVLPTPARSSCRHFSRSKASMFSHRLMPPKERGSTTGAGAVLPTMGAPVEGVITGVWEGVTAGVWDGVTAGAWDGVMLGVVCPGCVDWARVVLAAASSIAALRIFNMGASLR